MPDQSRNHILIMAFLIILAGLLAYSNSFQGAFVYDDFDAIADNPHIRTLWPLSEAMSVPLWNSGATVDRRPVLSLSFALNRYLLGPEPWSYHVGNLLIHLIAGLLLFGIVRRTMENGQWRTDDGGQNGRPQTTDHRLQTQEGDAKKNKSCLFLAFTVAILWVVHPLQTESVTYISQRAESLMGLFYLLVLYCAIRGFAAVEAGAQRAWPLWAGAAVLSCWAGAGTKEVMASVPLMVLLYDVMFVSLSFRAALKKRAGFYFFLSCTWLIHALLLVRAGDMAVRDLKEQSVFDYMLTQPGVLCHYLRLSFWPYPLVLDYNWPAAEAMHWVVPPLMLILGLLSITWRGIRRHAWYGFLGAWFFLILAPSSSFYPCQQRAFEHRMYLPLAAVLFLIVAAADYLLRKLPFRRWSTGAGLLLAATLALGYRTFHRNTDYRSEITVWESNTLERPESYVAHYNLGCALRRAGEGPAAIRHFRRAIEIFPGYAKAHNNLGVMLNQQGLLDEAIFHYREAIRHDPHYAHSYSNLGSALDKKGDAAGAIENFRKALALNPRDSAAHNNWGNVLMKADRAGEAIDHYQQAAKVNPANALAYYNWANALAKQGRFQESIRLFEEALRIEPHQARFHLNLATALELSGDRVQAAAHMRRALELDPSLAGQTTP